NAASPAFVTGDFTDTSLTDDVSSLTSAQVVSLQTACNSEWSAARRGRVWCSTKSGGVQRYSAGVPRVLSPGSGSSHCVCPELLHSENP
ncbi:neuferricin-like, partial [Salvelinus alpinus]